MEPPDEFTFYSKWNHGNGRHPMTEETHDHIIWSWWARTRDEGTVTGDGDTGGGECESTGTTGTQFT
jgi:hypothetical protein